jgi:Arc/MetJ-type ribon-helix-helix transcriptional regulator
VARVEVLLPDDLERSLRVKVAERMGGRRGDLGDALQDAVRMWISSDAPRFAAIARDNALASSLQREALEALGNLDRDALPFLLDIAGDNRMASALQARALALAKSIVILHPKTK